MKRKIRDSFSPPPLSRNLVSRSRLIEYICEDEIPALTLITAPSGFGKTTLMLQCFSKLQAANKHVSWITIEEFKNYKSTFEKIVDEAIGTSENSLEDDIVHAIVFIDDLHFLNNISVTEYLSSKLLYNDNHVSFIVGSRHAPDLPLGRLRMLGQLREVTTNDLRFSTHETMELLNSLFNEGIAEELAQQFNDRVEGWVAAVQLLASNRNQAASEEVLQKFSGRNHEMVEFLGKDVLNREEEHIREFIINTSVCSKFTGPLCEKLTGRDDSSKILEHIEHRNLFISNIDKPVYLQY